jgi:hypothetical protein
MLFAQGLPQTGSSYTALGKSRSLMHLKLCCCERHQDSFVFLTASQMFEQFVEKTFFFKAWFKIN